jgi:VanZ family protein
MPMTASEPADRPAHAALRLASLWYTLAALMLLAVAVLSLMPAPDTGVSDKLLHLVTYFLLGGWFAVIARDRRVLAWSLLGLVGYGVLIELLQAQTGYRYAEWGDVLANTCGSAAGCLLHFTPLRPLMRFIDRRLASLLAG